MSPSFRTLLHLSIALPLLAGLPACAPHAAGPAKAAVAQGRTLLARDPAQFQALLATAKPGDRLVLADGVWRDFRIDFFAQGTEGAPITLAAQTPGKVILSGKSNLRLAGSHLVVTGLVFRDGYTPTGEVIAFRGEKGAVASHSRVTETVIDAYNRPARQESDHWVALYGSDNRFDHNHIAGKTNQGATLVVIRDPQYGLDNRHRIDRNYFGPRPSLGSNGGETIRVGTSHQSRSDSHTTVEYNYFERCDGEVEIISSKSGGNIYRGNVFMESAGALTLRHGNGNVVEDNVFFGNARPHTGGIRVINRDQIVRNNYLEGLAGKSFASAVAVLNGVPDGPINRYDPVVNAQITNNSIIDAASIELGAGADKERSAPPTQSRFASNLITGGSEEIFRIMDDVSGITFDGNVQTPVKQPALAGITRRPVELRRAENGLLYPTDPALAGTGVRRDLKPITKADVGVSWYPKDVPQAGFGTGHTLDVAPGDGTLSAAFAKAGAGDILSLSTGLYRVEEVLSVAKPLWLRGAGEIRFSRPTLFRIEEGGALRLTGVTISGADAPDATGNAVIRTADGMGRNYELRLEDSRFTGLDVNNAFHVVAGGKGSLAGLISVNHSIFQNITGAALKLDAETDDLGLYNAERVEIAGSEFSHVKGGVLSLYRGGKDESTFGPKLDFIDNKVTKAGSADIPSLRLHGVQAIRITGNRFTDSGAIKVTRTVGEPVTIIQNNEFKGTPAP
ncbi:chondroitinase-B domain-containing protein [Niveispirillum sp. KHB5.9]|uniref:chondroitinase-B domain-containing protein n=1 Tax=Niveispirillum sp. KHB5.9 TaxID=3400269 RepID=UPI003A8A101F